MKHNIPNAVFISISLALALTTIHGIWSYVTLGANALNFWNITLFFLITFLVLMAVLEWIVFKRLKNVRLISQREIKKLRDLETYRRDFLGEVSHELKTPIFAIQGFIETLLDGAMEDSKVRGKFLKKASRNADRLATLVEDLLIITQAESGEMEMKIRNFPIYDVLTEVVDAIHYKFTKKNRNISCRIIDNHHLETQVLADHERIHQVLVNLIDNAVKYGDANGEVTISFEKEEDKLLVSVSDNGPGIEEEHLGKIFRRFYRVDKSRSRDRGGTGLGLSICKHLIEAHGERLWVESGVGKGTTFTFSLKLAE